MTFPEVPRVCRDAADTPIGQALARWLLATRTVDAATQEKPDLLDAFTSAPDSGFPMAQAMIEDRGEDAENAVVNQWMAQLTTLLLLAHTTCEQCAEMFGRDRFACDDPEVIAFIAAVLQTAMTHAAATKNDLGSAANAPEDKEGDDDARPTP